MKKTLAAIIVSAVAASAANAEIVYENDGSKVEVSGSLRVLLQKTNNGADTGVKNTHSTLKNNDSRIGLKFTQAISDSFYAFGRAQIRFNGNSSDSNADNSEFGDLTINRAYAGLGLKYSDASYNEISFGKQKTINDDVGIAVDNAYGILPDYIPTSSQSSARYDYFLNADSQELQLSASYLFGENRDDSNNITNNSLKNGVVVGALYGVQAGPGKVLVQAAYGRTNAQADQDAKVYTDGFQGSVGYDLNGYVFSVDTGVARTKNGTVKVTNTATGASTSYTAKVNQFFVSPGFQAPVIKVNGKTVSKVYGNYLYERQKATVGIDTAKIKKHGFLLGVDYRVHKNVYTYVEGKYVRTKGYINNENVGKARDKAVGVGLNVLF